MLYLFEKYDEEKIICFRNNNIQASVDSSWEWVNMVVNS